MSFRVLVAHSAGSAIGASSGFNGERRSAGASRGQSQGELAGATKAYGPLADARAAEVVAGLMGGRRRLSVLWGDTVHIRHGYARMAIRARLKGVVSPSTASRGQR